MPTKLVPISLLLLCLPSSLLGCATAGPIQRTETVEVRVPVHVPLDPALLVRCPAPALPADPVRGEDLLEDIEAWKAALRICNEQLDAIRALQPAPP